MGNLAGRTPSLELGRAVNPSQPSSSSSISSSPSGSGSEPDEGKRGSNFGDSEHGSTIKSSSLAEYEPKVDDAVAGLDSSEENTDASLE